MPRQTVYNTRVSLTSTLELVEHLRAQVGARSPRSAIDDLIAWVTSDPAVMASFRAFSESRRAPTYRANRA